MRVILLEDDVRLGDKGNVVNVKRGFAVNYLIPEKRAVIFNRGNKNIIDNEIKQKTKKTEKEKEEYLKMAEQLKELNLEFTVKAALTGHIYGSITNHDVAEKIKELKGIEIPKRKIAVSTHIKTAGQYQASVKLFSGINVTMPLTVKVEEETVKK